MELWQGTKQSKYTLKGKVLPYRALARSWSRCTGSQLTGNFLSHPPAVGCHYFPPGLRSPTQLKNVTVLRPVPSYTDWWQRHICANNLPKVVTQLCSSGNWTHDLLNASPTPYGATLCRSKSTLKRLLCDKEFPMMVDVMTVMWLLGLS